MTNSQLYRIGGLVLLLGAVAFVVHLVARSAITAGFDTATFAKAPLWAPVNALGVLGAALVLLGLPVLCARLAGQVGFVGLLGIVLIALAWMFFGVFLSFYSMLVAPWLADKAPQILTTSEPLPVGFVIAFATSLLAELIGSICLAVPFIRRNVRPRWAGYALPVAVLLTVLGEFIAPNGPAADLVVNLVSNLGPMLLLGTFGYMGFHIWLEHAQAKQGISDSR